MLAKCQQVKHGPRGILSLAAHVSIHPMMVNAIASQFDFRYPARQSSIPIPFIYAPRCYFQLWLELREENRSANVHIALSISRSILSRLSFSPADNPTVVRIDTIV